ncbi:PREDICTED: disks large homolog 2-like [Amphimedon queenslandica]|uniref:Protein kinase domain-containing protein n=1 Tax=Amphimedon queenslandica TaxID=400682 RepID=A0AAN0IZS0_AMPQE|nr:PREDICTED: disks large homolog 2-like [Amphimedon queenslandica]|eukprot:XP_019850037.1 PREDICTED: disks large homolog 2-like [Amphimedon queenslandica]
MSSSPPSLAQFTGSDNSIIFITLNKDGGTSLGFSIAGGKGNQHVLDDNGVFVTKIAKGGAADKHGQLEVGDRLLEVNGQNLAEIDYEDAVAILKATGQEVTLKIEKNSLPQDITVTSDKGKALANKELIDKPRIITLNRPEGEGLGFNIIGGEEGVGIFISVISKEGVAARNGQLRVGDMILEVNGNNLEMWSHDIVAQVLKGARDTITLKVVYKPDEFENFCRKMDIKPKEDETSYVSQMSADVASLKKLNETLSTARDRLQKERDQELAKNNELKNEITALRKAYTEILKKRDDLQQSLAQSSAEKGSLIDQVRELEEKVKELENNWKVSYKDVTLSRHKLGSGGWGEVIIGKFRGQKVAVKRFHDAIMNQENNQYYLEMLNREINTMSQLRHPNLLQFIGAVLDHPSGNPMIITEVMDTSLRSAYEKKELTPDLACRPVILSIMRDVAVGLNYLHCLPDPIIHRDVSSANVLLESKGPGKWKTKISDFGSAKMARFATTKAAGAMVYSAPECLQTVVDFEESKQSPKADVFSYGILLCEVITCRFPEHHIFRVLLDQVRSSGSSLHSLVVSCATKDPEKRPTMKQIIEQLDRI